MDTRETYIKMCDRLGSMQSNWKPDVGDCFIQVYADQSMSGQLFVSEQFDDPQYETQPDYKGSKRAIWLPRQDRLQEMCGGFSMVFKFNPWGMVTGLFHHIDEDEYYFNFNSMEQLWLAFVMKEKHNKVWDGAKWE